MNNIQKLILLLIDEKEKAARMIDVYIESDYEEQKSYYLGKLAAFDDIIPKLELLLKDESNHPQPPISQTQMLGEVPQVVHSNISESSPAVEGETRLVGQNEQTKEHFYCLLADGYSGPRCYTPCSIEGCIKMRLAASAQDK